MTIIILGLLVVVVPELGIPGSWRTALLTLVGLGLIALGLYLKDGGTYRDIRGNRDNPFVENHESANDKKDII